MSALVLRFSSLGDVVLCASVTAGLGPVCFVTSARYAELARRFPGVTQVVALSPGEPLSSLRARLPEVDRVVDLHGSLRSRALSLALRAPVHRWDGQRLRRRLRVALKTAPPSAVVRRYAAAAGLEPAPLPWIHLPLAPQQGLLGVAPGAAHANKRWSVQAWRELLRRWPGAIRLFGAPDERALLQELAQGLEAELIVESGFDRTLEGLSACERFVGVDSGLTHLAAACGLPTVVVFGPTCSIDGFWPHAQAVELDLPCRPCGTFGGPSCPMGDHLCLSALPPERVLQALLSLRLGRGP